jgi:hypothetical protein
MDFPFSLRVDMSHPSSYEREHDRNQQIRSRKESGPENCSELNQNKSLLAAAVVEDYLDTTRMRECM